MKHLFLTLLACLGLSVAVQAQNAADAAEPDSALPLDVQLIEFMSSAGQMLENDDYDQLIEVSNRYLDRIAAQTSPYDTLCLVPLNVLSRVYAKMGDFEKTCETRQRQVDVFEKGGLTSHEDYPFFLGILASTYWKEDLNAKADSLMQPAVALYEERLTNNDDMAYILSVYSRIKADLKQYDEAIINAQRALSLYTSLYGLHDENVLRTLGFLQGYYTEAGYEVQAEETQGRIDQINSDFENGYVEVVPDFTSVERCYEHRREAYAAALYYTKHYLSAQDMETAARMIVMFVEATDEVTVIFGNAEAKWMLEESGFPYMVAYMGGCMIYAMSNEEVDEYQQYSAGIIDMLNFYTANKEITGEIPALEAYVALYNDKPEKLYKKIQKDYKDFQKEAKKGKTTRG